MNNVSKRQTSNKIHCLLLPTNFNPPTDPLPTIIAIKRAQHNIRIWKLHLRPEAKQGTISAFAQWIRETGQKPDRDGGHQPRS